MKNLSLLVIAILILGCGTETTVVEELEPVTEEPEPVTEEPEPVVMEEEPIPGQQIVGGNVLDGDVDVDPEPLNRDGIVFQFHEALKMYTADLYLSNGGSLHWSPRDVVDHPDIGNQVHLKPIADSELLEYDKKYWLLIYAQSVECHGTKISIIFRTKPR